LGTGFHHLTVLWMARCELKSLDGLGSMTLLKELYLAFNQIEELDILSQLEYLEILDLEGYSFYFYFIKLILQKKIYKIGHLQSDIEIK
jgi:Leucine-rich repeat (LRR) protein